VKPLAVDLCCGRGGWTLGLQAAGWHVVGFDVTRFDEYPGELVVQDVATLTAAQLARAQLIVASPPCEQFAVWGMRHFHPAPPHPVAGIALFRHVEAICRESGRPYVIENVAAARRFVGPSVNHAGAFHLWGPGVPALFPPEVYRSVKGVRFIYDRATGRRDYPNSHSRYASGSRQRREASARAAMIPLALARFVGDVWLPR
jgi:hypothetical protein